MEQNPKIPAAVGCGHTSFAFYKTASFSEPERPGHRLYVLVDSFFCTQCTAQVHSTKKLAFPGDEPSLPTWAKTITEHRGLEEKKTPVPPRPFIGPSHPVPPKSGTGTSSIFHFKRKRG